MELKIKKETATKLYPESPNWFKEVLVETFGEDHFKKKDWRDIKTFDDVCKANGSTEKEFNEKFLKIGLDTDTINYEKAKLVAKAINQGWTPDWSNTNQYKYYPWFEVSASGSGFSHTATTYTTTLTSVGSRLCFQTSEKAKFAGTQFIEIYKAYLL